MSTLDPGWYDDPAARPHTLRWWDGSGWTRWLSRDAQAPAPTQTAPTQTAPTQTAPSSPVPTEDAPTENVPTEIPPVVPAAPAVKASLAAAVLIGAVLVALVAVGAIVALSEDRLPTGPALAPPPVVPPIPKTPVTVDPGSRAASVNEFRDVQPGPPFVCEPPQEQAGLFSSAVSCNAPVHKSYNRKGDDWYASQVVGVLDESLVEKDNLEATVDKLADGVLTAYYTDERVTIKKRVLKRLVDIAPTGKAVLLTMEVHYTVRGLPSRYDKVVIGLFELSDGEYVTWVAGKPDDAPKAFGKVLDASAASVRALP